MRTGAHLNSAVCSDIFVNREGNQYFGFVDMLDVVRYVTDLFGESVMSKNDFDLAKIEDFKSATVKDLMRTNSNSFII